MQHIEAVTMELNGQRQQQQWLRTTWNTVVGDGHIGPAQRSAAHDVVHSIPRLVPPTVL